MRPKPDLVSIYCLSAVFVLGNIRAISGDENDDASGSYVTVHQHRYDPRTFRHPQQQHDQRVREEDYYAAHYYHRLNQTQQAAIDDRIYQYYAGPISPGVVAPDDYAELSAGQTGERAVSVLASILSRPGELTATLHAQGLFVHLHVTTGLRIKLLRYDFFKFDTEAIDGACSRVFQSC